jgi:signal transduction histidine kinase
MRKPVKPLSKFVPVLIFLGIWTLLGIIFAALSYAIAVSDGRSPHVSTVLWINLPRFYIWAVLSPLIFYFTRHFPVEFRPFRLPNLFIQLPALLFFSTLHQAIYLALGWFLNRAVKEHYGTVAEFYRLAFLDGLFLNLLVASMIVITTHAFLFYQNYREGERRQDLLKAELADAQLRALKMQLHPHFLFNTLHSISALVLEDPLKANSMIARLGDFLRLTLEHSDEQMVMLKQEIEFLRCYLEIEQVRFCDRLVVDFEIEPQTLMARVPHLILQPIVENAIRYTISYRSAQGYIKVRARQLNGSLQIEVIDNGSGLNTNGNPSEKRGVGLTNVRARLDQIYGSQYRVELINVAEGGLAVVIVLPFQLEIPARLAANPK